MNARAYTVGHDLVFDAGQYAPANPIGRRLLAHELTHVAQQSAAGCIASSEDAAEREAEANVLGLERGGRPTFAQPAPLFARQSTVTVIPPTGPNACGPDQG